MTMSSFIGNLPAVAVGLDSPANPACPYDGVLPHRKIAASGVCPCPGQGGGTAQNGGPPLRKPPSLGQIAGRRPACGDDQRHGKVRRADHDQEIRQPAALQHRHQHLRDARRPRHHGEGRRGFRGLRRQDRRRHHPLGAGADHLRAGEQGRRQNLLPINFLRQLIRFYGDSMQMLVPRYLEVSIDSLTREQEKFREQIAQAFGMGGFGAIEEQVRRNMEMFERTFAMFAPFARQGRAARSRQPGQSRQAGSAGSRRRRRHRRAQAPDRRDAEAARPHRRQGQVALRTVSGSRGLAPVDLEPRRPTAARPSASPISAPCR